MAARVPSVHVLSNVPGLSQAIRNALPSTRVVNINLKGEGTPEIPHEEREKLEEAEVMVADPVLINTYNLIYQLPRLKWMQSTFAGVDAIMKTLDKSKPDPSYTLTKVAGIFGPHMAEFTIGQIVARERKFSQMLLDQHSKKWNSNDYKGYRQLSELTLGVLGIGDIGKDVARAAKFFGMKVWGWGTREGSPKHPCQHIDDYRGPSGLDEVLENSDYVCSILPDTPQTTDLLSGDRLSVCKEKKSVFINIGRGNVIDESSILNALGKNWISCAILDVFAVEPLPSESKLWEHPSVIVTPHISAVTKQEEMQDLFMENYQHYISGQGLKSVVGWNDGY